MSTSTIGLIILAGIVAAALSLGQYYWEKREKDWWWFALLRFATYFGVFLLLVNPKIQRKTYQIEKPNLVLAVDNSSSIKEFGESKNVEETVDFLTNHPDLKANFEIDRYTFGEKFTKSDSLSFSEGQTQLGAVFSNLKDLYKSATAPTVIITDGNQTYGRDYEFEARSYNQEIFPVVVGDTTSYADVSVDQINVNRYAFLKNKFPVEVFIGYEGEGEINKEFKITQNGRTVYREQVTLGPDKPSAILTTTIEAQATGVHTYEAVIDSLKEEKNTVNNAQKFAVEVIDQRTNVLILASFMHPDLGAIKQAIERNQQRKATIAYDLEDVDLGDYQLVVLYQPDAEFSAALERVDKLEQNLLFITGTKTDYSFLNSAQPFFVKEHTSETEYYLPIYNSAFSRYQIEDIGFGDFPPLQDVFGAVKFKENINVLLYQSVNGYESDLPLLGTIEQNNRRFGFLFGENLWQWRGKAFRDTEAFEEFDGFIGKLVQYLASNKRRERLSLDFESFYNSGESILMKAHYFDRNYEFDPRGKLSAEITNKETDKSQSFPFLLKNNRFELNLSGLEAGEYRFNVNVEGENLSQEGEFTIIEFDVEKQVVNANFKKLERLAEEVYFVEPREKLAEDLLENQKFKPIQKSRTTQSPLIDWWYLLAFIALSLSAEWFLRKYRGLI